MHTKGSQMMTRLTVVIDPEHKKLAISAASRRGMALSSWVRCVLLDAARSSAHAELCATSKQRVYKIGKRIVTKEEHDAATASLARENAAISKPRDYASSAKTQLPAM